MFCTCLGKAFKGSPIYKQIQTRLVTRGQTLQEINYNYGAKQKKWRQCGWHGTWLFGSIQETHVHLPHTTTEFNSPMTTLHPAPFLTWHFLHLFLFCSCCLFLCSYLFPPSSWLPTGFWTCAFPLPLSAVLLTEASYFILSALLSDFLLLAHSKGFHTAGSELLKNKDAQLFCLQLFCVWLKFILKHGQMIQHLHSMKCLFIFLDQESQDVFVKSSTSKP